MQPENLKYKIVDISYELYEHCILTNIANNCNIYNHHTQLEFMKKHINYFLGEISFISKQAHNITKIPKNSDPFLHQIQKVLLQSKIRQKLLFIDLKKIYSYFQIHFLNNLKIFHPISTTLRCTKTGINHKFTQIRTFKEFLQQIG